MYSGTDPSLDFSVGFFFIGEVKPRTERVNFFTTEECSFKWLSQTYWSVTELLMGCLTGSGN